MMKPSEKKRISAALHKEAGTITRSNAFYQSVLARVLPKSVEEGRVSYAAAKEQAGVLSRKTNMRRKSGTALLGIAAAAALLMLIILPGDKNNIIFEDDVPLAALPTFAPPNNAASNHIDINCQTMSDGYIHVRVNNAEEVHWESVYALDANGHYVAPYVVYPDMEMAIFAPPDGAIVIYVPLMPGMVGSYVYE
ncbi:MAG: hypothetical protein FWG06_02270 [Clostridiales bacterium]|nr:hypothetical protein [Clostridiales bacterium]